MRIPVILSIILLFGCAGAQQDGIDCSKIHMVQYSPDFEKKMVDEIKAAPPDVVWPSAIADYRAMRRDLMACQTAATH